MDDDSRRLQVDESPRFSRVEGTFERVGWVVVFAVVLAGASGVFANGPLSHATARRDGVEVRYQRFARNQGTTTVEVGAETGGARDGEIEIWVSQELLSANEVEEISPEPASSRTRAEGVAFLFPVDDARTRLEVSFVLRPEQVGRQQAALEVGDGTRVELEQFVYP